MPKGVYPRKPLTEEHKQHIADAKRGIPPTEEHCKHISDALKGRKWQYNGAVHGGSKCNWWKGGITLINQQVRNSEEFKAWRLEVFERDDWICQDCGVRGGYLHAHHIKVFSKFQDLRFEPMNGITLCKKCHDKIRGKEEFYEQQFNDIVILNSLLQINNKEVK